MPSLVKEALEILDVSVSKAWFEHPEAAKADCNSQAPTDKKKKIKPVTTPYLNCALEDYRRTLLGKVESWWSWWPWHNPYEKLKEKPEDDGIKDDPKDNDGFEPLEMKTASVPVAYAPGLLAGGVGLSAVAGFGFLLSEDGDGAEGDPPSSARPDPSTTRPGPSTTGPGSSICEVSPSRCGPSPSTTRPSPSTTRPASGAYGYDSRALAASAQALGDASGNISGLMARPDLESATRRRSLIPIATGSAFWLRGFGSRARYREQTGLRPEADHLGIATGYDLRLNATQFGLLAGYGRGGLRFEGTQRFRPGPSLFKGPFAAFYVRRDFAPFSVQVGLAGGTLKHSSSRLSGLARAEARTRSWWLAPEARVGMRLDAGLMQFEPSFTARYARQSIRGFTETGIRAPATVGQRKVELLETRLELKAGREVGPGRIALKAGWQYRDDLNSNEAEVRLLGPSQRVRLESGLGSSLYLGAEAEFELMPGLFLNLSGEAVSGSGYRNMSGMASVYQAF